MKKGTKYDIFISYRRDGGESTAKILRDKLSELGYQVFFDVESLRSGDFNTKLYSVIEECQDFLLVLSPGALDRCRNEDDWVRLEIEHALRTEKNIIPVMLRGFSFPEKLPDSIEPLRYKNGVESNYQFFDAFIEKLRQFLRSRPAIGRRMRNRPFGKGILAAFLATALLGAGGAVGISHLRADRDYPATKKEENLTGSLLYYVQNNALQMELAAEYMDNVYEACSRYLNHGGDGGREQLLSEVEQNRRLLYTMDPETEAMTEKLKEDLLDSPFSQADAQAMNDYLKQYREKCISNTYFMEYITDPETYLDQTVREDVLENYREMSEEELKIIAYGMNELLLPIENEEALQSFKYDFLPQLYFIPLQAAGWSTDRAALISAEETSWNAIERNLGQVAVQIGEENMKLMETKAQLVEDLPAEGLTQEEAWARAEELSGLSSQVTEQQIQLDEAEGDLEEKLNEAREKFAPQESDDGDMLWGKMLRFLNLGLYEEAVSCLDAYREKVREQDQHAEEYVPAVRRFIENIGHTGIDYGLMVVGYEPGQESHPQYQIGDVIIAVNESPVHNFEEYSQVKNAMPQDGDYSVVVLRAPLEDSLELEEQKLLISAQSPRVQIRELSERESW